MATTWISHRIPDITNKQGEEIEAGMGLSARCLVLVDDKENGYPEAFARYNHKLNDWFIEGRSRGRFKVKYWTSITKPAHLKL